MTVTTAPASIATLDFNDRAARIRRALAIAPRPKLAEEKIDLLCEILFEAREIGDDALLLQVIQQATGALADLHAERARAAQG